MPRMHRYPVQCFRLLAADIEPVPMRAATLDALSLDLPRGAYTTIRAYPGARALHLDRHLDRLVETAALEGYRMHVDQTRLRQGVARALAISGLLEARVRLTLSYEPPGAVFIALAPFTPPTAEEYARGVRCVSGTASLRRETPRAKSTRFIGKAAEVRQAQANVNEVLLLGEGGTILEGSSSNFYAVLDGYLRTADEGVLAGVTRGLVLSLAQGLIPILLQPITVYDLPRLSEAFLTSVSRAVLPVVEIDGVRIGTGTPGPIARELGRRFAAHIERELEPIISLQR
jgi:branched-chain amino acid aminotransferase